MSYLVFHLAFIAPPLAALWLLPLGPEAVKRSEAARAVLAIAVAALLYTTFWDNYLVFRGVWEYGPSRVLGVIGYVPIEEYLFFVLQPLMTGLWYLHVRSRSRGRSADGAVAFRAYGVAFWIAVSALGAALLAFAGDRLLYLGLITAWCGPVLAGMTWIGYRPVWSDRRAVGLGILIPTLYLWVADRIAIGEGIWAISERYSTPLKPLGLPIEEALFFLVTNVMVVQGVAMLLPQRVPTGG